ncbi:uncharacterized protein LTR77_001285 [Saxophila tyrrhenica]|uniref:CST complex subunit STN1 n=1 Tax=Saxophila tyrrhenica TaxID=1690608 RepID=A0AAV9PJV3_9PEZI|nr:hypothetical protein LTR77_001285 [Saxophila tyrrhenica]
MTTPLPAPIYPKRYFSASPTWFAWNKLTSSDLHTLREEPGFESQHIYFHLNHPIRYVRLVGLVVDIDVRVGKYILITLDDSSGACIEIKTEARVVRDGDGAEWPSNTVLDNLDLVTGIGRPPSLLVDRKAVDIGTVVKVKGTIDTFRGTRQIQLERIWIVKDTNDEAKAWAETAEWKRDILGRPWVLSKAQRQAMDAQAEREAREERQKAQKRRVRSAESERKREEKERRGEEKRRAREVKLDKGALVGSSVVPMRVTDS